MDQTLNKKTDTDEIPVMKNELSFKLNEPVTTALNTSLMTTINNTSDDGSLSFVVLGKDSMENVQASSLASYVDIQQKSMSVDYKTMISSLSMDEMQRRLTELLQENVKLKETLKQNNVAMKQQFHILATWQEEVMKVHQSHKQKFAETRELINQLKKENADLKNKLLQWQQVENMGFEPINAIPESITNVPNQVEFQQSMLEVTPTKMDIEACKTSENLTEKNSYKSPNQLKVEKELESAMKSLSCNSCDTFTEQTSAEQISVAQTAEHQECSECSAKHQEIACLKESVALLQERLQYTLSPPPRDLPELSSNSNRQKFIQSMKQYNDILHELTTCFVGQIERFPVIEKNLKEITDILMLLDDDTSKTQFYQYREKLCHFCKQLADEQVKIITDRQILIKSQNQFQKILSDYNSILYELEITIDENAKLNVLKDNTIRESLQKSEELERIKQDRELFEEEKRIFDKKKNHLEEDKILLENQKRNLDIERDSLDGEKKLLAQEKISLNEEKMSLDQQSQLYEDCEKALLNERKTFQYRFDKLLNETNYLREELEKKNEEFKEVLEHLAQSTEEINLLRSQLTLYEEDFQHEKKLKEALLEEKSKLNLELQKQIEYNKQLQESAGIYTETSSDIRSESTGSDKCNGHARVDKTTAQKKSNYEEVDKLLGTNINAERLNLIPAFFSNIAESALKGKINDDSTTFKPSPCPKCEMRFHTLSALMAHIDECLEF